MKLREFDTVKVSGTTSSPSGLELDKVTAVIACVDVDHIKIWCDPPLPGKVWIPKNQITEITLVEPCEWYDDDD